MRIYRRIAAGLLAASLLLCGYHNPKEGFAKKPAYLTSATYFSDAWPMNFWNSESVHMEEELARIAQDGFNSLILVVPWREFQPGTDPVRYNDYAWEKLDRVMEAAGRHGLWVTLRVGYVWDYYDTTSSLYRFEELLHDGKAWENWKGYVSRLYEKASAHPNFYGGFLTWEDCWGLLDVASSQGTERLGVEYAQKIGFQQFVKEHYSLQEVKRLYGGGVSSYNGVYVPGRDQPAYSLLLAYYDTFLNRLLWESQSVFPNLSLEVRMDGDPVKGTDGEMVPFTHESTFSCLNSSYTTLMYSVAMGQKNQGEKIDAAAAIKAANWVLDSLLAGNQGKPIYIDQFLYMDATPEFTHNAQVHDEQRPDFIRAMGPVMRAKTMGYGVWTYRNYVDNMVYNPQFALGVTGWKFTGGCKVEERDGNRQAYLDGAGGSISPKITHMLGAYKDKDVHVRLKAESGDAAVLTVSLDGVMKSVNVHGITEVDLTFPSNAGGNLKLSSDRPMYVDDVAVYTYMQDGQLYDIDGNPLSCIEAIRDLNGQLR